MFTGLRSVIRATLFLLVFGPLTYLLGCSGSSNPTPSTPAAAAPAIVSVSPTSVTAGGAAFTLTVTGSGFVSGSAVQWNGSARTTTFASATQISAAILASDVATAGTGLVVVANPDGQKSAAASFTVSAPVQPMLTSLSPSTVTAGGAAFTLTVNGTGFISGATVAWAGSARTTTFVSSTQLTAAISASDLANPGTVSVDVAQGSVRSTNQLAFTVAAVVPTITSLSSTTIVAGSAGFNLTVNGTGFTNAASVTFNGSAKTTTFVSATQLTAAITAGDLSTALNATVDVMQGGVHAANTLTFAITVAPPVITSLSPTGVLAGSADTTLSVNGTGFFADSVVKWNGTALTTSYKSSTLLQATVPAASLISATTVPVTVANAVSEGGVSNAVTFTVSAPISGKVVQLISADYATGAVSNWANNNSPPTLSQDGRYVGFASYSSDLVAGDTNGETDAFLRDTCVGSAPVGCARSTTRLSVDSDGVTYLNGAYRLVVLSSDARYALFDTGGQARTDLRDDCIGATSCTPAISHPDILSGSSNTVPVPECCSVLSPDGRYVLFTALTSGGPPTGIYVRDTCAGVSGCTAATTHVVLGPGSTPPHQPFLADISSGGRYVLFRTAGNDIISTYSTNLHLFMEDTCIGAAVGCTISYTPIDVKADGTESEGNMANDAAADEQPSFSKDGRYVVFSSTDTNIVSPVTPHVSEVYVRDTCIGAPIGCVPATTLVSADPAALAKDYRSFIGFRSVSEHGRYVAFMQDTLDATVGIIQTIRVRDTCIGAPAGCVPSISNASVDPDGVVAAAHSTFMFPSISADGHYVAFMNGSGQVYLASTGY
jgi:hypothetical protein